MKKFLKIAIGFIIALSFSANIMADIIKKIEITGNNRIEKSTIMEYLGTSIGNTYSSDTKNDVTKSLYDTYLFKNIGVDFSNNTLSVNVEEMPFVSSILFEGNYKVKTKDLADAIYTAPGDSLNEWKIKKDIAKIQEMYQQNGRFSVKIKERIKPLENNRVKVIFSINEGPKTGIKKITFVGNNHYKNSELRSILITKESRWFRFLESNDTFDPDRIEYDKYRLAQFYKSVGYADFRVISATADLLPTKSGFGLTFSLDEGKKYVFGKTSLENNLKSIPDEEIWKFIEDKEGETFNLSKLEKMSDNINYHLASQGYPQVTVTPEIETNRSTGIANIKMVIEPAPKVFVNNIDIEGNLKTEDHVIRREMQLSEGDVFSREKLEKGQRNIRNLDFFDPRLTVGVKPTDVSDRYDIKIKVQEKSTASFGIQTGYNTSGGPFGKINFLERNLVGTGRLLNAGIQVGKSNISYSGGITDPNFMDKNFSLGQNFFRNENGKGSGFASGGKQQFSQISYGGTTTLGYNITDDLYHSINYSLKREILKGDDDLRRTSLFISQNLGKFITSSVGHTLVYDKTDSRVNTKNGYLISASQEYAGLGGNIKHLKHEGRVRLFKSTEDNKYTLKLSASAGHIVGLSGKEVKINDRFTLGDHSLRGFGQSGIGPRLIRSGEGLNGNRFYAFSAELDFPLGLPEEFDLTGSVFFDAGSLWEGGFKNISPDDYFRDRSLRASVGFGFTWVTKIAPIRMDWGFPVRKKKHDETQAFHIRFSAQI